ncbi:hypothetical protein RRG08_039960 [Elysia crispata]|uniref:Uncharacterized protein n=1 Tax=Elysia crispata TaxID=231223 RepID=A0AAE0Z7R1_9GAST|nr:hypothetical protein RRG08_039960 [Elysia crispata]
MTGFRFTDVRFRMGQGVKLHTPDWSGDAGSTGRQKRKGRRICDTEINFILSQGVTANQDRLMTRWQPSEERSIGQSKAKPRTLSA